MKKYILLILFFIFTTFKCEANIIKLIPTLEYAQNHTHILVHILNKYQLPLKKLNISLTSNSLRIKYELSDTNQNKKYLFNREINLFSLCKSDSLYIKKENEYDYVIFFQKTIPTFYWNFLDEVTDGHDKIYVWFDLYQKYQTESKFNEYRDFVESNLIIQKYNKDIKEKESNKLKEKNDIYYSSEKRNNKLNKIKMQYEDKMKRNKDKNKCICLNNSKKCYYPFNKEEIYDLKFWLF